MNVGFSRDRAGRPGISDGERAGVLQRRAGDEDQDDFQRASENRQRHAVYTSKLSKNDA